MNEQLTSDELRQVLAEWIRPMYPKQRQKIAGLFEAVIARAEAAKAEAARLAARVAELESQLAEQGWRPGAEKLKHDWYLVYDFSEDDRPLYRFYGPAGWQLRGDRIIPNWYMPIPPLPPAARRGRGGRGAAMTRRALAVALLLLALMACGGNGGDDKPPVCTGNNRPVCALPTSPPEYHGWACPHVDVDAPCIPLPPTPPVTPEATE